MLKKDDIIHKLDVFGEKDYNFDRWSASMIFILIIVFGAIFGFIYEEIFYRIDLGHFVKRGTTFGPWIPIYGIGAAFITIAAYRMRKKPIMVFALACVLCGALEFTAGYLLFHVQGVRLWDYNVEIWNWGNIGGYICLRSVLFFGISGLFLVYAVVPLFRAFASRCSKRLLSVLALVSGSLFLIDVVISDLIKGV